MGGRRHPRHHPVLLRRGSVPALPRPARGQSHRPAGDPRHPPGHQLRAGEEVQRPLWRHGAALAGRFLRRHRRRSGDPQAGGGSRDRRAMPHVAGRRRAGISFLYPESPGAVPRHLPPAGDPPGGGDHRHRSHRDLASMDCRTELERLLAERILVLDGAMGTMIQGRKLEEADFRGERFKAHPKDLKGNNDLLSLTRPDVIAAIHRDYLEAGADILETNTFNSTSISQADYGLEALAYELNLAGARIAKGETERAQAADGQRRFVAGILGPTNRTASISPKVEDPGFRNVSFDELKSAYADAIRGLLDGGSDLIMVETIFDTLNCKAALVAIEEHFEKSGHRVPVMISATITDLSGRTLSGQTVEAFWNSVRHVRPFSIGLNCALGADQLRPYVEELSRLADCYVSAHPNAGLPNAFGGYDETPAHMSEHLGSGAKEGSVDIVGGCCGSTPEHIRAIKASVAARTPRSRPAAGAGCRLAGLEACNILPGSLFVNVGERTNVTGSAKFKKLVLAGDYPTALEVAREQVQNGAQLVDVNMDEGLQDGKAAMVRFLSLLAAEPDIARVPVMLDSSRWEIIEAGLKCLQGKCVVNSISLKEGEESFLHQAGLARRYGAAVVVMAFDEQGQADTLERRIAV